MSDTVRVARSRQMARLPEGERPPAPRAALAMAKSKAYQAAADAPGTLRAYKADLKNFKAWCASHGFEPMPAAPETVGAYLAAAQHQAVLRTRSDVLTHFIPLALSATVSIFSVPSDGAIGSPSRQPRPQCFASYSPCESVAETMFRAAHSSLKWPNAWWPTPRRKPLKH
jgi:hypothetical protein